MNNNMKLLREQFGYTQQYVADSVGVSRQTIISLEAGKYNPSIFLAYHIAQLFNTSIESVFIFEEAHYEH